MTNQDNVNGYNPATEPDEDELRAFAAAKLAFKHWNAERPFTDEQLAWLDKNTFDFEFYHDNPAEFFSQYGYTEKDGTIKEYGAQVLKESISSDCGALDEWEALLSVGSPEDPDEDSEDDRLDPAHEPAMITREEWDAKGYYAVTIEADPGEKAKTQGCYCVGYEDYLAGRDLLHAEQLYITSEKFQTPAEYLPGLLTADAAISKFQTADDRILNLKSFPEFSKRAKIKLHDSVVLAADTGAGKSSLAINFLNDLNDSFPILYINLEMDELTVLRRLVAVRTGIELDQIEQYKNNLEIQTKVNNALKELTSRKPLQVVRDVYAVEDIEKLIKRSIEGREDPTVVIVDHSLLVQTRSKKVNGRYERFTHISEALRRISKDNNIILFILLQQNREGKKDEAEPPKNYSLKESGSWENDATQIVFLWRNPEDREDTPPYKRQLRITKNRSGETGIIHLNYWPKNQNYKEVDFVDATPDEAAVFEEENKNARTRY